jgi:hypothetical protein
VSEIRQPKQAQETAMKSLIASALTIMMTLGIASTAIPASAAGTFVNSGARADGAG